MSRTPFKIPEGYSSLFVMVSGWIGRELTMLLGDECDVRPSICHI